CVAIGDDPRDGGLVHRLDIGTSGVLVAARTQDTYHALRAAFGAGQIDKQYLAIIDGRPVSRESDAPLAQRGRRVIVDYTDGLAAYTAFSVERTSGTHALVRCAARTGRMHQVRAHLAHVGSPIAGDELYGGAPLPGIDGFFLHAARIELPLGVERLAIEAPLPARFLRALEIAGLA
ncbi:MAG: RluA family pseudouridine synthase, partial [Kofleriaceae bacterium]